MNFLEQAYVRKHWNKNNLEHEITQFKISTMELIFLLVMEKEHRCISSMKYDETSIQWLLGSNPGMVEQKKESKEQGREGRKRDNNMESRRSKAQNRKP